MLVVDNINRTCLHHAAAAGNSLGIRFTIQVLEYRYKKETGLQIEEGKNVPAVEQLLNAQTTGGVTPLMKAAEVLSTPTVLYLLQLGADPFIEDNRGRNARRYVLKLNKNHDVYKYLLKAEQ